MTNVKSHTRHEQQVRKEFRAKLNTSESSEDVRKCFVHSFRDLMHLVFNGALEARNDDAALDGTSEQGFRISRRLMKDRRFREEWDTSDLASIVCRLALTAGKRIVRFEKNFDKTESKLFHDHDLARRRPLVEEIADGVEQNLFATVSWNRDAHIRGRIPVSARRGTVSVTASYVIDF